VRYSEYPDEYRAMFFKALDETVKLQFSHPKKAIAFRVELYKFRYAVRDELPKSKELYDKIMKVSMSITDQTLVLQTKKATFVEKLK